MNLLEQLQNLMEEYNKVLNVRDFYQRLIRHNIDSRVYISNILYNTYLEYRNTCGKFNPTLFMCTASNRKCNMMYCLAQNGTSASSNSFKDLANFIDKINRDRRKLSTVMHSANSKLCSTSEKISNLFVPFRDQCGHIIYRSNSASRFTRCSYTMERNICLAFECRKIGEGIK